MSSNLKVNTILPSAGSNIGLGTNGGNLNVDGGCKVQVGTALTLGHTVGVQFATQNLHSAGFEVNQINASGIITASHFYGNGANLTGLPASVTINNASANRVLTSDGGTTLNGEANLIFDGTDLGLGDSPNNIGSLRTFHIKGPSGQGAGIRLQDNGDTVDSDDFTIYKNYAAGYLRINGTDPLIAYMNGAERVHIDSSGRLGIGANNMTSYDSIAQNVLLASSGNTGITIRSGGSSNYGAIHFADGVSNDNEKRAGRILYEHSSDSFIFYNANTYALKIDSSQRLLIGTPITDNRDGYNSAVQIGGTSGDTASMSIGRYSDNVSYPALILSKSRNGTINNHTRVNTGDYLGGIQFQGDDGTRFLVGASIVAQAASPVADYDMATDLIMSTNSGTTSPNKSMTLDHQGRFTKPFTPFVMAHINTTSNRNSSGSQQKVPWDVIHGRGTNSNMGSHFDTSNHRFTAPVDGRYLIVLSLNEVGDNIVYHRINNTQVSFAEYRESGSAWDHMDASFIYDMNANDYYETWSLLTGGGHRWNGGGSANGGWDTLSIYLLG